MVLAERIELTTPRVRVWYSDQLSYASIKWFQQKDSNLHVTEQTCFPNNNGIEPYRINHGTALLRAASSNFAILEFGFLCRFHLSASLFDVILQYF